MSHFFNKDEIKQKAAEFKLSPEDVERDYIQSWIIKEVFEDPYLGPELTLRGSGALRKLYQPSTRFARDLDFSARAHLEKGLIEQQLHTIGQRIQKETGIEFVEEVDVRDKNLPEDMHVDAVEARMYFKSVYGEGKFDLKTQVDVTRKDVYFLPPQSRTLIHPYADAEYVTQTVVRAHKIEEIIASKFITLLHRRKAGDLFDLVHTIFSSREEPISKSEVIRALLARTDFPSTEEARTEFLQLPLTQRYTTTWGGLIVPVQSLITLDRACQSFTEAVTSFFGGLATRASTFAARALKRSTFTNIMRERIVNAGQNQRVVIMRYKDSDHRRVIEPYKFEYYTRESDKQTFEYLWGFDQTGGTSGQFSIKRYFCDDIRSVEETDQKFTPQWEIEF